MSAFLYASGQKLCVHASFNLTNTRIALTSIVDTSTNNVHLVCFCTMGNITSVFSQ